MSGALSTDNTILNDDIANMIIKEVEQMALAEKGREPISNKGGSGFSADDDAVINELTSYKLALSSTERAPGEITLKTLSHVAYDPTSTYAKKTQVKKETYYSKFSIAYPIKDGTIDSRYCSVRGAILDLLPRPLAYGDKPNSYSTEYVAVYFPASIIEAFRQLIVAKEYALDEAGINFDSHQGLVSINANYSTDEIPRLGIHRENTDTNEEGVQVTQRIIDKSRTIEEMYKAIHDGGGALFRGYVFGEFGVSKQVSVGSCIPPAGATLKLTFKLLGFHVLTDCKSVRAIRSKSAKSKSGV